MGYKQTSECWIRETSRGCITRVPPLPSPVSKQGNLLQHLLCITQQLCTFPVLLLLTCIHYNTQTKKTNKKNVDSLGERGYDSPHHNLCVSHIFSHPHSKPSAKPLLAERTGLALSPSDPGGSGRRGTAHARGEQVEGSSL